MLYVKMIVVNHNHRMSNVATGTGATNKYLPLSVRVVAKKMFCQENLADFWRAPAVFPRDPAKSLSSLAPTAIYNLINRVRLLALTCSV